MIIGSIPVAGLLRIWACRRLPPIICCGQHVLVIMVYHLIYHLIYHMIVHHIIIVYHHHHMTVCVQFASSLCLCRATAAQVV